MPLKSDFRSIKVRLPAVIVLVLLVVMAAFSATVYRQVRQGLTEVAEARLTTAVARLRDLLARSREQQVSALRRLSEVPAVREFLADGSGRPAAQAALDSAVSASEGRKGIRLRSRTGETVWAGVAPPDSVPVGFGAFHRAAGDTLRFTVGVRLGGGASIEGLRQLTSNPESTRLVAGLIGADARFLIGNPDGSVWTDMTVERPAPAPRVTAGTMVRVEESDGAPRLGLAAPLEGSEWVVWVDFPEDVVEEPLAAVMGRLAWATLALLAAGGLFGWWLSGRITRPLGRLTAAAEAIAEGDYSRRIRSERRDEIGRLGNAFDAMAAEVERARDRLEQRVAARTAELEQALADLHDAQEELVRKERLALLGELAGGVGHELRNPLGVMTNAVFYLESVLRDRPDDVHEYLGMLRHQIHLSEKIVSDLLDFARVKPPQRQAVGIEALVAEQVDRAAPGPSVSVSYSADQGVPDAFVDPEQVGQVVLNLVTNAVQAVEAVGGGEVRIRASRSGSGVRLEVEDTGPGIPERLRAKIFEPLFTTRARGIGLGLSVSQSLAAANGGELTVESEPGQGATFALVVPAAEQVPA